MSKPTKKFNSLRATRLTLLLAFSLTAGIGTAIYKPLATAQVAQVQATPQISQTLSQTTDMATTTTDTQAADSLPQAVQTTQAPVIATTRGS
ncbi:hypothetical protein [Deinococcus sp.]|uniref:hypothetical protein n=1 Tax=Deinococcus sp. TaxID=47478 RepID=UPI003B5C69E0